MLGLSGENLLPAELLELISCDTGIESGKIGHAFEVAYKYQNRATRLFDEMYSPIGKTSFERLETTWFFWV
jgi:hypothetical protein